MLLAAQGAQGQNTDQLKAMIGNLNKLEAEKELVRALSFNLVIYFLTLSLSICLSLSLYPSLFSLVSFLSYSELFFFFLSLSLSL